LASFLKKPGALKLYYLVSPERPGLFGCVELVDGLSSALSSLSSWFAVEGAYEWPPCSRK
jgi:hypothetical protein